MTELSLWRARIGNFNFVYCAMSKARDKLKRVQEEKLGVADIVLGYLSLCFLVLLCGCARENAALASSQPVSVLSDTDLQRHAKVTMWYPVEGADLFSNPPAMFVCSAPWCGLDPVVSLLTDSKCVVILAINLAFCVWRLILSHDVEQNPGPPKKIDPPKQDSDMENRLSRLETTMDEKLSKIMKAIENQTQSMLNIEAVQTRAMCSITEINKKLSDLSQVCVKNSEEICELKKNQDDVNSTLEGLQDEIDRLEGFSRRNNIKLFGIPEGTEESTSCEEVVTDLLKKYYPDDTWDKDVIERAHRLGKYNSRHANRGPRPVIAKFQRWGDAMCAMRNRAARDNMEKDNIRLAQDLTKRQSDRLRSLREEGRSGYFVKGRLQVRDAFPFNAGRPTRFNRGAWRGSTATDRVVTESDQPIAEGRRLPGCDDTAAHSDLAGETPGNLSSQPIGATEGDDVRGAGGGFDEASRSARQDALAPSQGREREKGVRPLTRAATQGAAADDRQVNLLDMWSTCSTHDDTRHK
jgi:hypothetical protein